MKRFTILLLTTITINVCFSQKTALNEVTIEQLKETKHKIDTSAVASVIFHNGRNYFQYNSDGFNLITEVECKIKIYKKEGYEYGNVEVPYYIGGSSDENVVFSKMATYNLVNGKIEKTKPKSENEFKEEKNKNWAVKKIAFPAIKEGSIIEYKYTIRSPFYSVFPDWKFQKSIPVDYSRVTNEIPEYFTYNAYSRGYFTPKQDSNSKQDSFTLSNQTNNKVDYKLYINSYTLENIPALKQEPFVNNLKNYTSMLEFELASTQFPNQLVSNYSSTWEDVAKKIFQNEDFGNQLKKTNYFEDDFPKIVKDLTEPLDKMNAIFSYVQSKMTWNSTSGYTCDKGVVKSYNESSGNTAEINLMLISMLKYAKIDTKPVLISTRSNGISLFPSRTSFNWVIAECNIDGKKYLLDATSKIANPNILPFDDLNWTGRIILDDGQSTLVDLAPKESSVSGTTCSLSLDNEGTLSGTVREQKFDYFAYNVREKRNKFSEEQYLEKKEKDNNNIEINDYSVENLKKLQESIIERYKIKSKNNCDIIGNKMYFAPLGYLKETENPFKQEERLYPVDFGFPFSESYRLNITIPEGYNIEGLPAPKQLKLPNDIGVYKYNVIADENQLIITKSIEINQAVFDSEEYFGLKELYKHIVQIENEKVVFVKK
ncbi:DUF3857 domain-containing protein [Flavobacterium croceum]|uniref:DUF3857 domain-containing protein n=1 Tax=Flavobacterium croceum TaxID=370975 RepID=UPI0024A8120F|nr:DUF3857 domain-containing protein [Flavobacterium croceum]